MAKENLYGAVDLGENQFVVLTARPAGSSLEIVGCGHAAAAGFAAGKITSLSQAAAALASAVHQAEVMAGGKINQGVVAGVSGKHIFGESKHVPVKIQGGEVTDADVILAMDTLQAYRVEQGMKILHVLEQEYSIDGHGGILDPKRMTGNLLEAQAYVVTALANALTNLHACVAEAGLSVQRVMCTGLATGSVVTTADERELGVITLDWGGGTCDIAVFQGGVPRLLRTLELGGSQLDLDIAQMHHIPLHEAQRVKCAIGSAVQVQVDQDASVEVKDATGQNLAIIEPHVMSMSIESRMEEMLKELREVLTGWLDKNRVPAGVVIAGGMSELVGIVEISHDVLDVPVRLGKNSYSGPHSDEVAGSAYTAALGLLQLWAEQGLQEHQGSALGNGLLARWWQRLFGGSATISSNA